MFSPDIKFEIKERASYISELSGEDDRPLHCSHFNHDRQDPETYNSEGMGFLITDIEHYVYHERFLKKPGRIGLSKRRNKGALIELTKQIYGYDLSSAEEIAIRISEAKKRWDEFFGERPKISKSPHSREVIPPLAV